MNPYILRNLYVLVI